MVGYFSAHVCSDDRLRCKKKALTCWFRHGSILIPVLFVLLINLIEFRLKMRGIQYANHIAIFVANKTVNRDESENVLNKDIDQLTA